MSETLADLMHRSVDATRGPHLDVALLVAEAGRRQRHQRWAVAATAAVVVGLVAGGSFAVGQGNSDRQEPGPAVPSDPPSSVEEQSSGSRPLVYAVGRTVHVGDDSFEARANVTYVAATDDGVVFMTGDVGRGLAATLWFNDGSTSEDIGRVWNAKINQRNLHVANPGSLVVWADATSRTNEYPDRFVVYDTSRHEVVTRLPLTSRDFNQVLHLDESSVFFNPAEGTPGCWVLDAHRCTDPHLLRYDVASGSTEKIAQAELEAELSTQNRMFVLASESGDTGTAFTALLGARFDQVGRRLVPVDSLTRTSGEPVDLRAPEGFSNTVYEISVVQWLDDDRVVLWSQDPTQDDGDLPYGPGALITCTLSEGGCRVAFESSSNIQPPGL